MSWLCIDAWCVSDLPGAGCRHPARPRAHCINHCPPAPSRLGHETRCSVAFRNINVGAGHGPFDELVLDRYPAAQAVLLDGSAAMLAHADGPLDLAVSCIAIHNLRQPAPIRRVFTPSAKETSCCHEIRSRSGRAPPAKQPAARRDQRAYLRRANF
jgi:hypothetical protein